MTLIGTAVLPVMTMHISAGPSGSRIAMLGVSKLNVGSSLCVLVVCISVERDGERVKFGMCA